MFVIVMATRGVVTTESIWDKLVFGKIQALLGGRLRYVISGSAPLSAKVLDFTRCAFGCIVSVTLGSLYNISRFGRSA